MERGCQIRPASIIGRLAVCFKSSAYDPRLSNTALTAAPLIQRPLHYALQLCLQTSIYSTCSLHSAVLHLCWLHDVSPVQSTHRPDQLSPQSWRVSIWNASTIEFTSSPSQRQLHLNDMQRRFQVRHVRGAGPPNVKASNLSRVLLSNGPD